MKQSLDLLHQIGLNPFEIRAELPPYWPRSRKPTRCLNPFEIRAELPQEFTRKLAAWGVSQSL